MGKKGIVFIIFIILFSTIICHFLKYANNNRVKEDKTNFINKETTEEITEINKEKSYDNFMDFPDYNMNFINDNTFNIIREIYNKIDFSSEYKQCSSAVNNIYRKKYNELLKGKIKFTDNETKEEFYINEYEPIKFYYDDKFEFDVNNYDYYFFDIDEDNVPELCVFNAATGTNIFKYINETDKMVLWCKLEVCWYHVSGSKTVTWNRDGKMFTFYKLDKDGKIINVVSLLYKIYNADKSVYLVTLPGYSNKFVPVKNIGMMKEVYEEGYFAKNSNEYYFRVNEAQFEELFKNYSEALEISLTNIKNITFSYNELFGDL